MRNPAGDHIDWKLAIELYYQDRIVESYDVASRLGTGLAGSYLRWYRFIEAEYLTRTHSKIERKNDWLQVELISAELPLDPTPIIVDECERIGERFRWSHGHQTLISMLAIETDAPWTSGRHGFCIDKQPYAKICLPNYLIKSDVQLRSAVAHEYAHVMSGALSQARAPMWLDEAVAMVAGDEWDPNILKAMRLGNVRWLTPFELTSAYGSDRRDPGMGGDVRIAYHQSGVIGRYLCSLRGENGLSDLMRAFTNNSFWTETRIVAGLMSPVDEALREVYGLTSAQVFDQAREWLREGNF